MDQKNTIVKCKAHPNCLFNYNGVCDNYVINIGVDGKCECYVETELAESVIQDPVKIGLALKEISKQMNAQRGQRTKCNVCDDICDKNNCGFSCAHADTDPWGELWCCLNKCNPKLPWLCPHYIERMIKFGE